MSDPVRPSDLPEVEIRVKQVAVRNGDDVETEWRAYHDDTEVAGAGKTPTAAARVLFDEMGLGQVISDD